MSCLKGVWYSVQNVMADSASEAADIAAANDYAPEYLIWSQKLIVSPEGSANA